MKKLDFLIVGTMKSGTSTLSDYLSLHNNIFIPDNELHYFNNDKLYFKDKKYYDKYYYNAQESQICGEKTPTYSYLSKVPPRIYNMNPNAKLIWIFREPVARTYSNYWHAIVRGAEKLSFTECVESESEFMKENIFRGYVNRSIYIEQVKEYLKYFDIKQMHFILFEELVADPKNTILNTLDFLEVEKNSFTFPNNKIKSNERKSLPRSNLLQYYSRKLLKNTFLFKVFDKINQKPVNKYPPMDNDLKKELIEYFMPYNKELEKIVNKDLTSTTSYWHY
ncbi:sulfotransferase [Gracilibacillus halophilus YIM-C55.5]|uniref:Sulfotransferase n=1 Tax=Gracilibacillus halophilus YIM-C55.5 TaxID=1308866 RepID=N4WCX0_9BACI|nr:sulfotransferase domain-containing protein [Gracilibacillus halophilus]ENH98118.1 sulfotransferase [Gracilibacillus halophilus YIM-C55.5]